MSAPESLNEQRAKPASRRGVSVKATVARTRWQRRKRTATRGTIHEAALRLFERDGYDAVTTRRVAEEAGVSAITLFRYFPTKEDLVLGVPADDESLDRLRRMMGDRAGKGPLEFVRDVVPQVIGSLEPSQLDGLAARLRIVRANETLTAALYARIPKWTSTLVELWNETDPARAAGGRVSTDGAGHGFPIRLAISCIIGCAVETLLAWSRRCDEEDADPLDVLADLVAEAMDAMGPNR